MKFLPYIFLLILLVIVAFSFSPQPKTVSAYEYDYLRIHILANSNSTIDQQLKYKVKSKIVEYLTPSISECKTKEMALNCIDENIGVINAIVDSVLKTNGVDYKAESKLSEEYFPSRYYEDYILEEGYYSSLTIKLGEGEGDNWWCVVYPPLCFVNKNSTQEQNIVYQSKIVDIIEKFFKG